MAINENWKIGSRSHRCALKDRPFADEESFYTCIFEDPEGEGYIRKDYCVEAWDELKDKEEPFSFWQSTYKAPVKEQKTEAIEKESAEGTLRRMIEEDQPGTENARYILAIMLERKKTLKPVDVKETDSRRMLFYEHKETGDVFIVADPRLRLDEVEKVQEEVMALLNSGAKKAAEEEEDAGGEAEGEKTEEAQDAAKPAADSNLEEE